MCLMRETRLSVHSQEACNPLDTNQMHRPDRNGKPHDII
jgi:hypothetical protein